MMSWYECNYTRWTPAAIACYKRGCVCAGCEYKEMLGASCRMKCAVINLVKNIGRPEEGGANVKRRRN